MKLTIASILSFMLTNLALAAEIKPSTPQEKGVNEKVAIQFLGDTWGYSYEMNGFYMGTAQVKLVPVTREAAQVLRGLNKKARYNCLLQDSTLVEQNKGS